ncbi:MAG: tRNA lysidine(34) synthetase TilS [Tissierellia bacterium]|nr:tRNA lysidine(34) synthetase TilS [Tissierellia bacterium]
MFEEFKRVIEEENLINDRDKVLVACSGGADSMTLLSLFLRFFENDTKRVEVAHINHCLRGDDSLRDQEFVEKSCIEYGIKCHVKVCDIESLSKNEGLGIEEMGRKIRYGFFHEITNGKKYKIALAHNLDDQAETVLMRIIRGTGTEGLMGIRKSDGNIIRPLLNFSRREIEKYVLDNKIEFVQDNTNFENKYTRNKIRNQLIPYLEDTFNPNIKSALVRLAQIATSDFDIKNNYVKSLYERVLVKFDKNSIYLDANKVLLLNRDQVNELFRYCISLINDDNYGLEYMHFTEFSKILESTSGKSIAINKIRVTKSFRNIVIERFSVNDLNHEKFFTEDIQTIINGYRISVSNLGSSDTVVIRKRKTGDRVFYKGKYRKLKDLFIDKKINFIDRDYMPIIELNGEIIACGSIYRNIEIIDKENIVIEVSMED